MATTRDFKSLGIFAANAETTIPAIPVQGISYRNEGVTEAQNEAGEAYATAPDSAQFNQKLFIATSFTDTIDRHGVPGWSNEVDYATLPAIVYGSDLSFYLALLPSGPTTGAGIQDPISAPTYWEKIITRTELASNTGAALVGTPGGVTADKSTILACARCTQPGTIVANSSLNISSMTRTSGVSGGSPAATYYTIVFTSPLSSANYFVDVTTYDTVATAPPVSVASVDPTSMTVNGFIVTTWETLGTSTTTGYEPGDGPGGGISVRVYPYPS